jgi:hypothetical protein
MIGVGFVCAEVSANFRFAFKDSQAKPMMIKTLY